MVTKAEPPGSCDAVGQEDAGAASQGGWWVLRRPRGFLGDDIQFDRSSGLLLSYDLCV